MRKKTLILILFLLFFIFNPSTCNLNFSVNALDFSAKAYILYCPENKKILLEKNANEKLPIASTTKIMTSLIALEIAKLKDEDVTITNEMLQTEGSSMGLKVGDFLPISSLVKGMLTVSAVMLTTSTFAWFSINKRATVKDLSLRATVSSNLLISSDNSDDSTYVKDLEKNISALLEPASTVNGEDYFYTLDAAADGHKLRGPNDEYPFLHYTETQTLDVLDTYADKTKYDSVFNLNYNIDTANPDTLGEFKTAYGYVDYVMYLKATSTEENQKIVLSKCNMLYKDTALEDKAWRAALFVQETSAKTQPTSTGTLVSILSPDGAENHNANKAANTISTIGTVLKNGSEAVVDDTIDVGETKYYKIVLRVWIEGEDKTCTTEVYGKQTDKYKLNLEFVIDSDTNGITKIGSEVEGG